jgi:WD40 repeat protein
MSSPYSSERRASRQQSRPEEGVDKNREEAPNHRTTLRRSYLSSRATSNNSTASISSTTSTERMSSRNFSSLTHEDEIERIRENRAQRLRQEAEFSEVASGGNKDDNLMDRIRQRRSEEIGQNHSGHSNDPSHKRITPMMMSRREMADVDLVRKDVFSSRMSFSERDKEEASFAASSYMRARRERGVHTSQADIQASGDDPRATTRWDIEARMAARRRTRRHTESDLSGSATQVVLDELRSRREETKILMSDRTRGSSAEPRGTSDVGADNDYEGESNSEAKLSTKERMRQRVERRGIPRRTKSADEDLMTMRGSARNLFANSEPGESLQRKNELEARRLERQNRPSLFSSTDLGTRLKERREARAEREARQREKKESSESGLIRHVSRTSTIGGQTSGDHGSIPALEFSDDESEDDPEPGWSVRLNVVSAMDLPLNVVSSIPLCPIIKLGLVRLPISLSRQTEQAATEAVMSKLGSRSVEVVKSAKVRTTTQKILGKRDNGAIDFHEEYRWNGVKHPKEVGLCVELWARAVRTPKNFLESPSALSQRRAYAVSESTSSSEGQRWEPSRGVVRSASGSEDNGGFRNFWKSNNKKQTELEAAEAAAAVARLLVEQEEGDSKNVFDGTTTTSTPRPDYAVTLRGHASHRVNREMTENERLGSLVIPLSKLPLDKAFGRNETVRLEQWYQLELEDDGLGTSQSRKKPSVLLEISFSAPEVLDDSEDELDDDLDMDLAGDALHDLQASLVNASFARRSRMESREQQQITEHERTREETKVQDPTLEPGVVDFVAVVGCKDIGKQTNDDGSKGWVKSNPESVILEQFPSQSDYHVKNGRNVLLPEMVQWFCFPEGVRIWRGTAPPSHIDLDVQRFSVPSPSHLASSVAAFDACLNCTASFSWFVFASNSDEYGSTLVKTYGAVIRFYVPAPTGIDPTQDDFAHSILGNVTQSPAPGPAKRLWVPIGICLTSNLPIIGILEALLLRICEELSAISSGDELAKLEDIQFAIANMVLNYQKPIAGAVNCSVPFLNGDRFLISLPPPAGLPPIPHGRAIVSVCRLLGAEGLNYLIAAVLTECKILFHSQEIADIAMVAEVITALTYPFVWSLPYIPVLPVGMLEFVEAPLSYILGIPTCNLKMIDSRALDDVLVVDLNNVFSSMEQSNRRRQSKGGNKYPTPLPASVARNISKAVYKLLRLEEEMEEEFGSTDFFDHVLPRLESESLPEREFRVEIAIEICGLLRGYQGCVGTVFNRDKFLKMAPALYEERRDIRGVGAGLGSRIGMTAQNKSISARSKRFLSLLVNGQNFHQLIESLESTEVCLFYEIMELIDDSSVEAKPRLRSTSGDIAGTNKNERNIQHLVKSVQKIEEKIPTYRVAKGGRMTPEDEDEGFYCDKNFDDFDPISISVETENRDLTSFTTYMLSPIESESDSVESSQPGKQSLSMEYLAKLEETPWEYNSLFHIPLCDYQAGGPFAETSEKVKLRDAIGERRFRAWKSSHLKRSSDAELAFLPESARVASKHGAALNLNSLVASAKNDMTDSFLTSGASSLRESSLSPEKQKVADAKYRDIIRRCLDRARKDESGNVQSSGGFVENGRDLLSEAENALRHRSAQLFLLKILAQRSRLESKRDRSIRRQTVAANSVSRLDPMAFNCLVRLSCAMLDSCMEFKEFEPAYRLLTYTSGFITMVESGEDETEHGDDHHRSVITMTSRVGLHPIFADLGVWEYVMKLHLLDRASSRKLEDLRPNQDEESADEEEDEIEYEAAVATLYDMLGYGIPGEELPRFAMRASEENGWFCDDRGRKLVMRARRISIRRDQADIGGTGDAGDIEMFRKFTEGNAENPSETPHSSTSDGYVWKEIGWCHPAAPSARVLTPSSGHNSDSDAFTTSDDLMRRSPVTAVASFGSSIVVSGGLDGGVFMAHSIRKTLCSLDNEVIDPEVRGIHLDWGSASRAGTGSSSDGEYGVGAVSCLAAAFGGSHYSPNYSPRKDVSEECDEKDLANAMEGSRIVAGTTAGDLRVWSVKDICSAITMTRDDEENAVTRLKFSLRGRALSGHRGGVTCIDAPSQLYRPDSLVTGGADGLIKLWSLRAPSSSRRAGVDSDASTTGLGQQRGRGGDAIHILNGHLGRIQCIQTAWHGDHLLSGGADRTIRVWDVASGGGKSLHTLCGHFGWVTSIRYWGPNTVVSASTDRTVALWDARVRNSPLFILRHHLSPISNLLVGPRTDPYMVSAGTDGSIAAWDFRLLSEASSSFGRSSRKDVTKSCTIVREPSATMQHNPFVAGPTLLARGMKDHMSTFWSVGSDATLREWNVCSGSVLEEIRTGHCDAVTALASFVDDGDAASKPTSGEVMPSSLHHIGMVTSSLDGTVRLRKLVRERHIRT